MSGDLQCTDCRIHDGQTRTRTSSTPVDVHEYGEDLYLCDDCHDGRVDSPKGGAA